MTIKERVINRIMAMASLRGDMSGRGSLLTDYDEAALATLADAAAATEARRANMRLVVTADGDWRLVDDLDGEPFDDGVMTMFEDFVTDRLTYLIGSADSPPGAPAIGFGNRLARIRAHRY